MQNREIKIFFYIQKQSYCPLNSLRNDIEFVGVIKFCHSKIIGEKGGGGAASAFYSVKLCISFENRHFA